jgi:hypothetical protein
VAVTLWVVIEQSLVTVTLADAAELEPEATVVPRTATVYCHGATAPVALIVILTRALFVVAS